MTHDVTFPKLGLEFTVQETAFSIGGFHVRWYGVIIAVGFLLAVIYASRSAKKMNIDMNRLIDAVIAGLIGGVVCARLFYVVFSADRAEYFSDPIRILQVYNGGLAIYGGVIGAVLFGGLMAKARKLNVPAVLDVSSLGFLIGQCLGRWGNFVNQECFGTATDLPWGMYSDNTELVVPGSPVHPCFLYESLLCLLGFVLLHFFTRKLRRYDGQTFILYLVYYGACRFFIEGLRTDSLYIPGTALRVSQVIAGSCVAVGLILLTVFRHRTKLSGCGSAKVMEGVGLTVPETDPESLAKDGNGDFTTIFTESAGKSDEDAPEKAEEPQEETKTSEEAGQEEADDHGTEDRR